MRRNEQLQWRRFASSSLKLDGLHVAAIGGTGGIGRAIARELGERGARVTVVGRSFRDEGAPNVEFVSADLSSMREAQRVGRELRAESLDLVVLTTGIMAARQREQTAEGLERDLAISYLSRLVIIREVGPRLGRERTVGMRPRVFIMGFPGGGQKGSAADLNAEKSYASMKVHMNTVAGNEMLVLDSATRYPGVDFFGLNPGAIATNIRSNMLGEGSLKHRLVERLIGALGPSAGTYAQQIVPLLVSPDIENRGGALFDRKGNAVMPSAGLTEQYTRTFLGASEVLVAGVLSSKLALARERGGRE